MIMELGCMAINCMTNKGFPTHYLDWDKQAPPQTIFLGHFSQQLKGLTSSQ